MFTSLVNDGDWKWHVDVTPYRKRRLPPQYPLSLPSSDFQKCVSYLWRTRYYKSTSDLELKYQTKGQPRTIRWSTMVRPPASILPLFLYSHSVLDTFCSFHYY